MFHSVKGKVDADMGSSDQGKKEKKLGQIVPGEDALEAGGGRAQTGLTWLVHHTSHPILSDPFRKVGS